ncbi:immunity 49 family protein [Streptomyces nodosus]|uniref:immunity 49 family protein n=1 Tax=Streptomyces nodosus TaxID=40318 RepID=UPI0017FE9A6F|nr:immunity 49 family protein [Streptomyces nodosus]MBB4792055.1 hypothetical protein [Streptomyces nodosus]
MGRGTAMRIERHRVGEGAVAAARENFADRIGTLARSMSKAGWMTTYEWWELAEEFLDYLGALSVSTPDLYTPEARAVLDNATEAAAGAVAYAAYHPHVSFHIFLDYLNFGMSYEPGSGAPVESVTADLWLDAFCLAILSDRAERHGEAFHFARRKFPPLAAGQPAVELAGGFMAYVIGDTGDDDAGYPPSREEKLAALDAALTRIRYRDDGTAAVLHDPRTVALQALRALTTGDEKAFRTAVVKLLLPYAALNGPGAEPRTLLPLLPLALAALGHRREGWQQPVATDYFPRALVTGFESAGPRVGAYGRDRRPEAVAEAAAGPVTFARPEQPQPLHPESEALFEQYTREAVTPRGAEPLEARGLASAMNHQRILFKIRATQSPDATGLQLRNLRLAAEAGAALFSTTLAQPDAEVQVTIDGHPVTYRAYHGEMAGPGVWHTAVNLALITGRRENLAPLVLAGPTRVGKDESAFAAYRRALHDYLRGEDPEAATELALQECEKARTWGFLPPPAVLFSQLVEGDEESFQLALLDALEAHRDHYAIGDRATDPDAALSLDILALACHARRRGWEIRVRSPYLPARLLEAAKPF